MIKSPLDAVGGGASTATFDRGVLVSLPWNVVRKIESPSALFEGAAVDLTRLPQSARAAFEVVLQSMARRGAPVWFTPAPEMFTGPVPRAWLKDRLNGVIDHIALSDGETVRFVPGLRNHVFLYGLYQRADRDRFNKLAQRVPDFLATFDTQINTAFSLGGRSTAKVQPKTIIMMADLNSQNLITKRGKNYDESALNIYGRVIFIEITELSLKSHAFRRRIYRLFSGPHNFRSERAVFHISTDSPGLVVESLNAMLRDLWPSGLPSALSAAECLWGPLTSSNFKGAENWRLIAHEAWPFWHFPFGGLARLSEIDLCSDGGQVSPTILAHALQEAISFSAR